MFALNFISDLLKQGYFREAGRGTRCHHILEVPHVDPQDLGSWVSIRKSLQLHKGAFD